MAVPSSLQKVQLWPIRAQGAIIRHNPLGDPKVEKNYHQALEDGRWLERNTSNANNWLLEKKLYIQDKIATYLNLNKIVIDGKFRHDTRFWKYIADSISFLQSINQFQQDIAGIVVALQSNISLLTVMQQNLYGMAQENLNALALLLNNVCNWGLPALTSFPNLVPDGMFNWNGFNFSPLAGFAFLKPNLTFSTSFALGQCVAGLPDATVFSSNPGSVLTYSGLPLGTPLYAPPLGGEAVSSSQDLSSPSFISQMQQTTATPVYGPTFNPNSSMFGSVPDPSTIISNYQMPAQTYHDNIVSIAPSLRSNVVEPGDPDYQNPDYAARQPVLRKDLIHFVTLDAVVNSGYDPYITSAWLFYLDLCRAGRQGIWLSQYEAAYGAYIQPSVDSLAASPVPWNNVLGGTGVSDTPASIPLVSMLTGLPDGQRQVALWKLSYIEASLLGYTRSKTWDAYQDATYLSGVTGADLDYRPTTLNLSVTSTVMLGEGTAQYPTPCTFPTAMAAVLNEVIIQAGEDIQNDTAYSSPRLGNRFVYNQFAQATMVDRFSQFWRDFNTNMVAFLAQDSYLTQFAATYVGTLDGAVNPLGDQTAYAALKTDAATRSRTWVPGTPLLPIPIAPVVTYSNSTPPTSADNGWSGTSFDPVAFLSRPDIQGQPIPVQIAMLRTNLSYASLLQSTSDALNAIQSQIDNATALIQQVQQLGFLVQDNSDTTLVPAGSPGVPVAFETTVFDITGNVTNSTTFTIQTDGEYAYFGSLAWEGTDTGQARTVTVFQNGQPIFTQSTDPSFVAPFVLQFSGYGNFSRGDVVQVEASHGFPTSQTIGPAGGSSPETYFSMIQSGPQQPVQQLPPDVTDGTTQLYTADTDMIALTVVSIQPDGGISPIDPTQAPVDSGSGTLIFPFVDGVALADVVAGNAVEVTAMYGAQYTFTAAELAAAGFPTGFAVGGLLYVGFSAGSPPGPGVLTQDYDTLIANAQWVICVGKAITADSFIYEPHLPQRILMTP